MKNIINKLNDKERKMFSVTMLLLMLMIGYDVLFLILMILHIFIETPGYPQTSTTIMFIISFPIGFLITNYYNILIKKYTHT
jgi:hypothetical protein